MTIKLYCFGESGNAYKAALPLHLSGLDYEMIEVDFFGGETRSPEYRANINEMGEAPVMIDGDMDAGAWSCGMVAGLINDIPTCQELIDRIMSEAEALRARLVG